jgi:DNA-binding transcriptional ArsR family regulator
MVGRDSERFHRDATRLADIAKALAHPARIRILQILAQKDSCICGEIVELLPLSQSTVSQHLKELKRVGLIKGEIEGPKTCYCLDKKVIEQVGMIFSKLFSKICSC